MSTIHAYTGDQMILDGPHRTLDRVFVLVPAL